MSIQEAMDKINAEAAKGGQVAIVAKYIIEELLTSHENAEKILNRSKSLSGAMASVKSHAQKVASGGMAMIEDNEVFGWIREYYEISDLTVVKPVAQIKPPDDLATISLFDLM